MSKPNVLFILSDQQRYDTLRCAGFPHMITPNLDQLAQEGTLYSCAHSSNPVCMPARHDILTGFPARAHGYFCNIEDRPIRDPGLPTLPRIFSENGYRTAAIGKMHFYPTREHHGFGEMHLMEELPKYRQDDAYATFLKENGYDSVQNLHGVRPLLYHIPQNAQMEEACHGTNWVAERTGQWLEENAGNPFFLMCGFIQPHPPWDIPPELDGLYGNAEFPEPISVSRLPFEAKNREDWYGDTDTPEQKRSIRKAYYTAVSMVDKAVGRILDSLRQSGQYDNTLILFTSDHGEMLQDKGYYSKELPYDSSVRVPLIIKYPKGWREGETDDSLAGLLDIFPTCLDICGLEYPGKNPLAGASLRKPIEREYQYAATGLLPLRWVLCRNNEYKYVYHFTGGYEELYRCGSDETENLLRGTLTEEQEVQYQSLKEHAIAYEAEWGPEGSVKDGAFVPGLANTLHPSVRGKYHFWANHQTQAFTEVSPSERGERLLQEMWHAISNPEKSAISQPEHYSDPEWMADFTRGYEEYAHQPLDRTKLQK